MGSWLAEQGSSIKQMRDITQKTFLIVFIFALAYCIWWLAGISHLQQTADDNNVGKTLLIYHSAGRFVLNKGWYRGKKSGDSYFTAQPPLPEADAPPKLYRVVEKYRTVNNGPNQIYGPGFSQYLLKPVAGNLDRRLFLFLFFFSRCTQQTDLTDPATGVAVDFICQ